MIQGNISQFAADEAGQYAYDEQRREIAVIARKFAQQKHTGQRGAEYGGEKAGHAGEYKCDGGDLKRGQQYICHCAVNLADARSDCEQGEHCSARKS